METHTLPHPADMISQDAQQRGFAPAPSTGGLLTEEEQRQIMEPHFPVSQPPSPRNAAPSRVAAEALDSDAVPGRRLNPDEIAFIEKQKAARRPAMSVAVGVSGAANFEAPTPQDLQVINRDERDALALQLFLRHGGSPRSALEGATRFLVEAHKLKQHEDSILGLVNPAEAPTGAQPNESGAAPVTQAKRGRPRKVVAGAGETEVEPPAPEAGEGGDAVDFASAL